MRDEDKPFICYKQGWSMKIVPKNAAGWRALGLWMAALIPPVAIFIAVASSEPRDMVMAAATAVFLIVIALWSVIFVRWALARSEIVDLAELLAVKRAQDRADRRRGKF